MQISNPRDIEWLIIINKNYFQIFVHIRCFPVFSSLLFFVMRVAREALFWVFALELLLPRWRGDSSSSVISRRSSCFLLQRPLSQRHSFQRWRESFSFLFPHFHFAFLSMCSKKRKKKRSELEFFSSDRVSPGAEACPSARLHACGAAANVVFEDLKHFVMISRPPKHRAATVPGCFLFFFLLPLSLPSPLISPRRANYLSQLFFALSCVSGPHCNPAAAAAVAQDLHTVTLLTKNLTNKKNKPVVVFL